MKGGALAIVASTLLAACSVDVAGTAFVNDRSTTVHLGTSVPVLEPDGRCSADASIDPGSLQARHVALGIGECDLVRLEGPPDAVSIREGVGGSRQVEVAYRRPAGRRIYVFTDNRLVSMGR